MLLCMPQPGDIRAWRDLVPHEATQEVVSSQDPRRLECVHQMFTRWLIDVERDLKMECRILSVLLSGERERDFPKHTPRSRRLGLCRS